MNSLIIDKKNFFYKTLLNLEKIFKKEKITIKFLNSGIEILKNDDYIGFNCFINKDNFKNFIFKEENIFYLNISLFLKNLKSFINNSVEIIINKQDIILKSNQDIITFPIEECFEYFNFPDIGDKFNFFIDLDSSFFNKKCKMLSSDKENDVIIILQNDKLNFSFKNIQKIEINLSLEGKTNETINSSLSSNFSLKNIIYCSLFNFFSENLRIYLEQDFPILMLFETDKNYIKLLLAPKLNC